jgi:hypothetical protein
MDNYYTLYLVTWTSSKKSHYLAKREGATFPNYQRSEMLQCLPGDKSTGDVRMCVKHKGTNLRSHEKGSNYSSSLPHYHTPIYHVMELRGEKWDCLQTNTHCDETKLHCWRENCTVYFSITCPANVRSFFTNYVVLFVNEAELYGRKCSSFVAILVDCAHMPGVCLFALEVEPTIFLEMPPIYHQFRVVFLSTSLLHVIMLSRSESML